MGVPIWPEHVTLTSHSMYPHFGWLPSEAQIKKMAGNATCLASVNLGRHVRMSVGS